MHATSRDNHFPRFCAAQREQGVAGSKHAEKSLRNGNFVYDNQGVTISKLSGFHLKAKRKQDQSPPAEEVNLKVFS